jgi:hypothetical protein
MTPEEAEVRLNVALSRLRELIGMRQQEQALKTAQELGSSNWLRWLLQRR